MDLVGTLLLGGLAALNITNGIIVAVKREPVTTPWREESAFVIITGLIFGLIAAFGHVGPLS